MSNLDKLSLEGFLEFAKEANTRSTLAVEDGLKPVHRRILYGMAESKYWNDKPFAGSAKVVGMILGNYHPHGDSSVYDAAVRMSQDFKMRYPLISFEGSNGKIIEPDGYAAMRYTKMKLSPFGQMMLEDIEKNTVDMVENYNGELMEPVVVPSSFPNLLLNGGMGIGVGVSSSLLPHNLTEVVDGIQAYIKNPRITTEELMQHIQGPDFPTGGVITDAFSLPAIYESGKGNIKVRAKYNLQTVNGKTHIVFTEIPYLMSFEERIVGAIQKLYEEEGYDKINDIQNNSSKKGLELRVILEKDANPNSVLQTLFEKTGLEASIKINNTVMLADGSFTTLGIRGLISHYLKHQHDVITRKYKYELKKAEERLNIVEGLIIAIQNIDEVVKIIKSSESPAKAKLTLIKTFSLNELQAAAILDMRLSRLTSLEINKLVAEKKEIEASIINFKNIIENESKREQIIISYLTNLKAKFGDRRRTKITETNIIEKGEHIYLAVDNTNQFVSVPREEVSLLGKGRKGTLIFKNPIVDVIECNTKETLLLMDINGKAYTVSVQDLLNNEFKPETKIIQIARPEEKDYIIFVTKDGIIKKTTTNKFKKSAQLTKVREGDKIIKMMYANDTDFVMVLGAEGKCVNLPVSEITAMGKLTYGSKGISTSEVLAATIAGADDLILTTTTESQGKLTKHSDFSVNSKGSMGTLITEKSNFILNIGTATQLAIFGIDGKAMNLEVSELAIKGHAAIGSKIYGSKICKIITV